MRYIIIYIVLINILSILAIAHDKSAARNHEERVRESSLFALAFLGGGFGMWLAMYVFHHKTRKKRFTIGVPLILFVEYISAIIIFLKFFKIF